MPTRGCTNRTDPAMTLMVQVTASPVPGPFTVSWVFPTARPVSIPVCGSKLAIAGSATLQRSGASGTGVLSAVHPRPSQFLGPGGGTPKSRARGGRAGKLSHTRFANGKVRLLHDHRSRRGEPAGCRRLDRALTRSERDDVAALIDARNVRAQRRPVDVHGRRRGAVFLQRSRRYAAVLRWQQIDDAGLEPQRCCRPASRRLAAVRIGTRRRRGRGGRGAWRRGRNWPGATYNLDRGLATPRSRAGLDAGDTIADTRYGPVVVDLGNVHVIR